MLLRVGTRLKSAVCDGEVIVVHAPDHDLVVECGGYPMYATGSAGSEVPDRQSPRGGHDSGLLLGKRYSLPGSTLELLCTKAGSGSLTVAGIPLEVAATKSLPSSD